MKTVWYWLTDKSNTPTWLTITVIVIVFGFAAVSVSGEPVAPRFFIANVILLVLVNVFWYIWNWVSHRKAMRKSARSAKPFSTRMLSDPTLTTVGVNLLPRYGDEEQVASGR